MSENAFQLPLPNFGDERRKYTFYAIVNTVTGKRYVGMTSSYIYRKRSHLSDLRRGIHHSIKLQRAYNKYEEKSFEWHVVERGMHTLENAAIREKHWIAHFDSYNNGYNSNEGGLPGGTTKVPCIWNGIEYESITDAANAVGISASAMNIRISKGYACDDDMVQVTPCEWNGRRFRSITDCADYFGVKVATMSVRIRAGYTSDEQMQNAEFAAYNAKPTIWNGVEYPTMLAAAKAVGVSASVFYRRLQRGYTSDADMPGSGSASKKKVVWNNTEYDSIGAAAIANGISHTAMTHRLNMGYSSDDDLIGKGSYRKRK